MKPPTNGARRGPMKTVAEKHAIASPRVSLSHISAKMAATTANGADPKNPSQKRQMRTVWMFWAVATPIAKIPKPKDEIIIGSLRP